MTLFGPIGADVRQYGKDEVNTLVTVRLLIPATAGRVGHEHDLIRRISSHTAGEPQIVTTNFDLLFKGLDGGDAIK